MGKIGIIDRIGLALWALCMAALAALALTGCATFTTDQRDLSYDPKTGEKREITTRATARTFAASKSALANWGASQTDKSQGASVGQIIQESQATDTLKAVADILKAARPAP